MLCGGMTFLISFPQENIPNEILPDQHSAFSASFSSFPHYCLPFQHRKQHFLDLDGFPIIISCVTKHQSSFPRQSHLLRVASPELPGIGTGLFLFRIGPVGLGQRQIHNFDRPVRFSPLAEMCLNFSATVCAASFGRRYWS